MKRLKLFGILILTAIAAFMFTGCTDKDKTVFYSIEQDGNFLITLEDGSLYTSSMIEKGTMISVKVDEAKIPENSKIKNVIINNIANQPKYQYDFEVDQNITLEARFEKLEPGQVRISLTGDQVTIEPKSNDNVYTDGEEITIIAPPYYKFHTLFIDDEKVFVDSREYKITAKKDLTIRSLRSNLVKTHEKLDIQKPRGIDLNITPSPDENGYYEIGTKLTLTPPTHYIFNGEILIDGEPIEVLNRHKIEYVVKEKSKLVFKDNNIVKDYIEIQLGEGLEVIKGNSKNLYEFDSKITIRAISGDGFNIIDKITILDEEIEVNDLTYEFKVTDPTSITATFKPYEGEVIEEDIKTDTTYSIGEYEKIYSDKLFRSVFVVDNVLLFSNEGLHKIRVDNGYESKFYKFNVSLALLEIKLKERTHSEFMSKENILYIGIKNNFKLDLVKRYEFVDIADLENRLVNEESITDFEHLNIQVLEKGIDVTEIYLEYDKNLHEISFSEESLDKVFEVILTYKGERLAKLVNVVDAYNVYEFARVTKEDNENKNYALQSDITLEGSVDLLGDKTIYGNYHSVRFTDEFEGYRFNIKENKIYIKNIRFDANGSKLFNVYNSSEFKLDNVTIVNSEIGICAVNSNLKLSGLLSKEIIKHHIVSLNKELLEVQQPYQVKITNSLLTKTEGASIVISDLNEEKRTEDATTEDSNYYVDQDVILSNVRVTNLKVLDDLDLNELDQELNDDLLVINEINYVNYIIKLDNGTYYNELFDKEEIINDSPNVNYFK